MILSFLDLTSADGRVSFSKLVLLLVLGIAWATGTFGPAIGIAAMIASHGWKTAQLLSGLRMQGFKDDRGDGR
jgi:hypothetical protein